jgi:arylsulfatase A-like enzyme
MAAPNPGIRVAAGVLGAALLLAAVSAGVILLTLPLPPGGVPLRVAHLVFDAAETVGVGALVAAAAGAFAGLVRRPRWASPVAAFAATVVFVHVAIGEELTRVASLTLEGRFEGAIFVGYHVFLGCLLPVVFAVGEGLSSRPRLRLVALFFAVAVLALDHIPLPDDYFGIHIVVAWGAALMGGGAIAPVVERAGLTLWQDRRGRRGRAILAAAAAFALFGVAFPPSNAVRFELFRHTGAIAPWILAATVWRAPGPHGPEAKLPPSPWFEDRSAAPPVPPSAARLLPRDAVVVLITIDAVRADAVADPANDALFPTLTDMKRSGVYFTHASSAASQTALSLSTLFTGRYFSELSWVDYGVGRTRHLYPSEDTSPRFPQILSDGGVATANFAGLVFLGNAWGVARGFREEKITVESWRHAHAHELIDPLLGRLLKPGPGPLFLYTHLMEPHEPYDRGRKDGTPKERYLSEIAVADAQVARVLRVLRARFKDRWALFVSADHGEAFGEHEGFQHGKTLYEELLHVPLLAVSPRFPARRVDEPVGLVDLGPTVLDLFGLDTPATFLGQSLAPILGGGQVVFTRPLVAEGRLRREITVPGGFKVIDDPRRKLVEAYDLVADPGETRNLFDSDPARVDPALATLRAFFAVHSRADVPYKP